MNTMKQRGILVFSHHRTGGGKPIDSFWYSQEQIRKNGIPFQIQWTGDLLKGIQAILISEKIIFDGRNSLTTLHGPFLLLVCLLLKRALGVYWHETEWNMLKRFPFDPRATLRFSAVIRAPLYYASKLPVYWLMRSAGTVHFHVCKYGVQMLTDQFHVRGNKVALLNNIANPARLLKYQLPITSEKQLVVACGVVSNRKRPDLFLEVAHKVCTQAKQVRFVWIGKFVDFTKEELSQEIIQRNLEENVCFVGYQEDPSTTMARAQVIVHLAEDDPMPKVLMEALGLGKFVVAFKVGGIPELLGEEGEVVPFGDSEAMSKIILEHTHEHDPDTQVRRRSRYLNMFSPESFAKRFADLLIWWDCQS